jgi:hypothetical protein
MITGTPLYLLMSNQLTNPLILKSIHRQLGLKRRPQITPKPNRNRTRDELHMINSIVTRRTKGGIFYLPTLKERAN